MERGSDKHSAMLDEALKHDTASLERGGPSEARSEEFREQEGPAEGEPTPDAVVEQLRHAPDRLYENVSEVWAALGGRVEKPRVGNGNGD